MSDRAEEDGGRSRFVLKRTPYARFSRLIRDGVPDRIDVAELAAEIRSHGVAVMPEDVAAFLCSHLEGGIERRGRKGKSLVERRLEAHRLTMLYGGVREAQRNQPDAVPEIVDLYRRHEASFPEGIPDSEKAWRMVSILEHGHDGHHKKLSNLASELAPRTR